MTHDLFMRRIATGDMNAARAEVTMPQPKPPSPEKWVKQ